MWPHPIFVINLKSHAARRRACADQLAQLGLTPTFVEAVDGREMAVEEISARVDAAGRLRRAPKPLTAGEVGCYLSHGSVLARIVAENLPQALVLEDDLLASDELPRVLQALTTRPSPPYDMVKLGISEPQTKAFTPLAPMTATSALVRHHNVVSSNLAYVITRQGAERFLRYGSPIRYPVDVAMNRSWRHGLDILGVRPWPVLPNPAFASSIGAERFDAPDEGPIGQRLERRLRKGYDSLAKRLDVGRRLKRDAAWRRAQSD